MRHPEAIQLSDIHRFSTTLAEAAEQADLATPVPTCGDWTMGDLVWHLTEVQDFWTFVTATRPKPPKYYEQPQRAETPRRLVANLRNATVGLISELEQCQPEDPAWSWAPEQTVGFTMRRQVHEALTHCVDGLLALDQPLPEVAPELAADGIEEIVAVMLGDLNAEGATGNIELHTIDTDETISLRLGTGSCRVSGRALPLNLWLWGRANTFPLSVSGDVDQARLLRATIADKTQ